MISELAKDIKSEINMGLEEYEEYLSIKDRRLYLTAEIQNSDDECDGCCKSKIMRIVDNIFDYNRQDSLNGTEKSRRPIRLYINSPGGNVTEGFVLSSAIELSKTPVYTINIGCWYSMAFWIGISGHRRFSLPNMRFLMHDGSNFFFDSCNKAQDKMKFDERFSNEVVKKHVLEHNSINFYPFMLYNIHFLLSFCYLHLSAGL